jgi:hypothetical protein
MLAVVPVVGPAPREPSRPLARDAFRCRPMDGPLPETWLPKLGVPRVPHSCLPRHQRLWRVPPWDPPLAAAQPSPGHPEQQQAEVRQPSELSRSSVPPWDPPVAALGPPAGQPPQQQAEVGQPSELSRSSVPPWDPPVAALGPSAGQPPQQQALVGEASRLCRSSVPCWDPPLAAAEPTLGPPSQQQGLAGETQDLRETSGSSWDPWVALPEPSPWHPPEPLALAWEALGGTASSETQRSAVDPEELHIPEVAPEQAASQSTNGDLGEWV